MPDWLQGTGLVQSLPHWTDVGTCLAAAAGYGVAVAAIYYLTQRRGRSETASLVATIVLLTILLAMVTIVIGENLARAFGLAGVLSIVRFRTVVDDTRDTAFVIYAVITGMAVGSHLYVVAAVAVPVVAVAATALSFWGGGSGRNGAGILVVKLGVNSDPAQVLNPTLTKFLAAFRVTAVGTARQGATLELTYAARLRAGVTLVNLILDLNRVEGVQGVEWKEPNNG